MTQRATSPSYDVHTIIVNAFVGFAERHIDVPADTEEGRDHWFPHPLWELGYRDWRIGPSIPLPETASDNESGASAARPDAAAFCEASNGSVLCEAKSQLPEDESALERQVRRYRLVRPVDVLQHAGFTIRGDVDVSRHRAETFIGCPDEESHALESKLTKLECELPIVRFHLGDVDKQRLRGLSTGGSQFEDSELQHVLNFDLDSPVYIPMHIYPFGPNSGMVRTARAVLPALVYTMIGAQEGDVILVEDVCANVFPYWKRIDIDARLDIGSRAIRVVVKASEDFLSDHVSVVAAEGDEIRIRKALPVETVSRQRLAREVEDFISRLVRGDLDATAGQLELGLEQ